MQREQSSARIVSIRVDATDYHDATARILGWAAQGRSSYVAHANVHMVMEAHDDPAFAAIVNGADLVTPDGMPLVWALRAKGFVKQTRVYGPTLMLRLLTAAEQNDVPVAFYGSSQPILDKLVVRLSQQFPGVKIVFARAAPYAARDVASHDDDEALRLSGARLIFVGLGCPKQERWMAARRGTFAAVMLGVGAAFEFHAGTVRQAPELLQRAGLEWAFRLGMEPRRLFTRYAHHNPRFAALIAAELLSERLGVRRR